jgi:hypothetical protein
VPVDEVSGRGLGGGGIDGKQGCRSFYSCRRPSLLWEGHYHSAVLDRHLEKPAIRAIGQLAKSRPAKGGFDWAVGGMDNRKREGKAGVDLHGLLIKPTGLLELSNS